MSQINELKREIQELKNRRLSWRAKLFIVLIGAPMVFLFALYGGLELAMPLTITISALGFVVLPQMEAEAARVVLDYYDGHRGASCSADSVCSLDYEVGSRLGSCCIRHGGFCSDPVGSSCCREIHGRTEDC